MSSNVIGKIIRKISFRDTMVLLFSILAVLILNNKQVFADYFVIRMIIAWVAVLILPGYLIMNLVYPEKFEFLEQVPVSVVFSIGYLVIPGIVGYLFRLRLELVIYFIILTIFVLWSLGFYFSQKRTESIGYRQDEKKPPGLSRGELVIIVLAVAVFAGMTFGLGWWRSGDSMFHMASVRKLAENVFISPFNAQFAVDKVGPAYGYNIWYVIQALLARISNLDSITIWHYSSGFLAPVAMLGVFLFGKMLFKNKKIALLSVFAFVLFYGLRSGMGRQPMGEFKALVYPNRIPLFIIMPVALYFTFSYFREGRLSCLFIAGYLGFTNITLHMNGWIIFLLSTGAMLAAGIVLGMEKIKINRLFRVLSVSILFSMAYLSMKWNEIMEFIQHHYTKKDVIKFSDSFYMVSPKGYIQPEYIIMFLIIIFLVIYLIRKREKLKDYQIFLLSNVFIVPFIMFNPLVAPMVANVVSYTFMHRLFRMIPIAYIFGLGLYAAISYIGNKLSVKWLSKNIITVLVMVPLFILMASRYGFLSLRLNYKNDIPGLSTILKENIKDGSIIASDPWTSSHIAQYSNNYVLVAQSKHRSPVVNHRTYHREIRNLFGLHSHIDDVLFYTKKYNIDYIFINKIPHNASWFVKDVSYKFDILPMLFSKVYQDKWYIIYCVNKNLGNDELEEEVCRKKEESLRKAGALFGKGEFQEAFEELKTTRFISSNSKKVKTLHEKIRRVLRKKNNSAADAALLSNNTTVEASSRFFYEPYNVEAAINGVENRQHDYMAARENTLPNWFILDFNQERIIHEIEIKWHTPELYGEDWKVEYYDGEKWQLLKEEKNWKGNEKGIYYYKFPVPVRAHKVKMFLTKAAGQDRMLIDRFSIDYSELKRKE